MRHSGYGADRPRWLALASLPMVAVLALPILALALASSPGELSSAVRSPIFGPALWVSVRTSLVSLVIVVVAGSPLAWWIAGSVPGRSRFLEVLVDLPIVLPPAVVGIALLEAFGRGGLLGPLLTGAGIQIPFTTAAVVLAQVVVSAPFYIQSAVTAFRRVDPDLMLVARTLGRSPAGALRDVAIPLALPGLLAGAALAWARALGEFGATLLFAGNLPRTTQTMPLAIYSALESDVRVAVALALALAAVSVVVLLGLRFVPGAQALGGYEGSDEVGP